MKYDPPKFFKYEGVVYPEYLRNGNAARFIHLFAGYYCTGYGVDVGAGAWPLPGAVPVEQAQGGSAYALPPTPGGYDYVFSSHCLEHLDDYVRALEHWRDALRPGGTLFLYLPHPDMVYWRPENCRKHRHLFNPADVEALLVRLGFFNVMVTGRDLAWSFCAVGFKAEQ